MNIQAYFILMIQGDLAAFKRLQYLFPLRRWASGFLRARLRLNPQLFAWSREKIGIIASYFSFWISLAFHFWGRKVGGLSGAAQC